MKKFMVLLVALFLLIAPINVSANSYSFNGYYCEDKVDQGDGTFKETCHILVTSDFDINHIKLTLVLKNVVLESVKTSSDWVSLNGLSNNMEFTSNSAHKGSFAVADLVFAGNNSDEECETSIFPELAEKQQINNVCAIIDNNYYGKNGNIVDLEIYYEECCNYLCTVVDNTYYFNSKGKSVTYEEMLNDCETVEAPQTGIEDYYSYIIAFVGIISIIAIIKIAKKNTKIYKI